MNKKNNFFYLAILSLFGLSISCSMDECGGSKDRFLAKYDKLMDTLEDEDYDKDHRKWTSNDEKFQQLVEECYEDYEDDMSNRELKQFWGRATRYYFKKFGNNLDLEKRGAEIGKLIEDNIGEVSEELGDAFKDIKININLDDKEIEELLGEFGSDLERLGKKWGEKLEEILEKED